MRARVLFAIACLVLFLARSGLGQACGPDSVTISGSITDSVTTIPISMVQVFLGATTIPVKTGSLGRYTLCAPPLQPVHVRARLIGYQPIAVRLDSLPRGSHYRLDLHLRRVPAPYTAVQAPARPQPN